MDTSQACQASIGNRHRTGDASALLPKFKYEGAAFGSAMQGAVELGVDGLLSVRYETPPPPPPFRARDQQLREPTHYPHVPVEPQKAPVLICCLPASQPQSIPNSW